MEPMGRICPDESAQSITIPAGQLVNVELQSCSNQKLVASSSETGTKKRAWVYHW